MCCESITQRPRTLVEKICFITELNLQTLETDVACRLQNLNPSQMRPSNLYNMCWQSFKVHLVHSSSAGGIPGAVLSYNHLRQSSRTVLSTAASPASASEEDADARLPAMSLYTARRHFLLFCPFPLMEKQQTLQCCKINIHYSLIYPTKDQLFWHSPIITSQNLLAVVWKIINSMPAKLGNESFFSE